MKPYVVAQGEYLTSIAAKLGFDADEVWSHEANRELRERRPNREVLAPGDLLRIPDSEEGVRAPIQSGGTHRYSAAVSSVTIRLVLQGCANEAYEIAGLPGGERTGSADGDGEIQFVAPTLVKEVRLRLPARKLDLRVLIGHLDPVDEASGERARLTHLGHLTPPPSLLFGHPIALELDPHPEDADERLARARRSFQSEQGLTVSGVADAATSQALRDRHGS